MYAEGAEIETSQSAVRQAAESDPLLAEAGQQRKPFYRPRPLWLVPFAVTAALVRGMTLAPRIEVFTQLSCQRLHGHEHYNHSGIIITFPTAVPTAPSTPQETATSVNFDGSRHLQQTNHTLVSGLASQHEEIEIEAGYLSSSPCLTDPAVQAAAARLQTIMTTTMGILSALTTGWWGHFGQRHGRTKVLALSTLGLLSTDLAFVFASSPSSPLSSHGYKLLIIAPIIEGALGGWSTLQSATSAYLSDCTSSGSRAYIFSRFHGVFYMGLSLGPTIGGYLIEHPFLTPSNNAFSGASVFWVSVFCSLINFIMVLFVLPESLDKVRRQRAVVEHNVTSKTRVHDEGEQPGQGSQASDTRPSARNLGVIRTFLRPLSLFLPAVVYEGGRKRRDWSLTVLGGALLCSYLSSGLHPNKYLYAKHVYGWSVEQLSYYISLLSGSRAIFLLAICPWIIAFFKPKPETVPRSSTSTLLPAGQKPKPTKAHLAREIRFDLFLTKSSLCIDILCNILVTLSPANPIHMLGKPSSPISSQFLFVSFTAMMSFGSGVAPALQSVVLCIKQSRALETATTGGDEDSGVNDASIGQLFGALAVLQTLGQMILGPMLFGLVYSGTVATFPKAIFVTAGGLLTCAMVLTLLVRGPALQSAPTLVKGTKKGKRKVRDAERGRSRISKDLRGGATGYGAVATTSRS